MFLIALMGGAVTKYLPQGYERSADYKRREWSDSLNKLGRTDTDPPDPPARFDSAGEAFKVLDTLGGKYRGAVVVSL